MRRNAYPAIIQAAWSWTRKPTDAFTSARMANTQTTTSRLSASPARPDAIWYTITLF